MKKACWLILILTALCSAAVGQTHIFPAEDTDNVFTGKNNFQNQVVIGQYQDFALIPNPGNPASGFVRLYGDNGSGLMSCLTSAGSPCISGSGGSSAFNAITSGTNTTAAMLVGTGSSLVPTGSGVITASNTLAAGLVFPGSVSGSTTLVATGAAGGTITLPNATGTVALGTGLTSGQLLIGNTGSAITVGNLSGDATTTNTTVVTVVKVDGVAFPSGPAVHSVPVITASNTATYKLIPDCTDSGGNHLNYTQSTDVFSCGNSSSGGGGGTAFSSITSATNTTAAMLVGTGASLNVTGSGSIAASNANGVGIVFAGSGSGSTILVATAVASGTITLPAQTGTVALGSGLTSGQLLIGNTGSALTVGNLSGDATTAGSAVVTVVKVDGVSFPSGPSTHQVPVVTASNTVTYKTVPDCTDTTGHHLNYTQSTDAWSCGTTSSGTGSPGGSDTQVQYNNAGGFGGMGNMTYINGTGQVSLNQLANGNETLYGKRATDSAPTGNFIHFQNNAAAADVFKVDVNGQTTGASFVTTNTNGGFDAIEGTCANLTAAATHDLLCANSTAHWWEMNNNNGTLEPVAGVNGAITNNDVASFASATEVKDAGFLASNIVRKDAANTGAAAMTFDMSASTSASALRMPNIAGASSTTAGTESYDTTNKNIHMGANGVDNINAIIPSSISPANNDCVKWTLAAGVLTLNTAGAACGSGAVAWSAISNPAGNLALTMASNTSTFNTTTALSQFFAWKNTTAAIVGTSQGSPILALCGRAFHGSADVEDCMTFSELPGNGNDAAITFAVGHTGTSTGIVTTTFPGPLQSGGSGAGAVVFTTGTAEGHATANTITHEAPASGVTAYEELDPPVSAGGTRIGTNASSILTSGFSGDANHSATVTIGSGTSIGSTSLCSTTFCPVGTYRVNVYVDITTACGTTGTYVVNLIYTDDQGSKTVPVNLTGTGSVPATGVLTTTSTANFGYDSFILRSTGGASINYSTTAVACGTAGPMVGKLYMAVEPVM